MSPQETLARPAPRLRNAVPFLGGVAVGVLGLFLGQHWYDEPLPPSRLEATVFLPLVDNADRRFSKERWHEVLGLFAEEFGGATLAPEQQGCWRDDAGRLRLEPVQPLVVSFESGQLNRFRRTVDDAGRRLGQEAVYVRFESPRIELRRVTAGRAEIDR